MQAALLQGEKKQEMVPSDRYNVAYASPFGSSCRSLFYSRYSLPPRYWFSSKMPPGTECSASLP
ncbi:solute carrier family 29 (nucleoside transporters) member 2 [Nannochloropsis gaditana CCMP526]|uniref:solute carrier family 29 (nucleoside transporters) member 2 n=1 Tax=Nannochloropsis gaditana (strain CCMP526) TaxID=1093141 RepID=UPI00029F57F1|nr:solute carrier family 29 (nucleoside transporters) member 2 [Nannochloropsis gaditana CCMP526]EKU22764.1 solute carrier family 29 (nucleoside transporters) member 2 [Nannochloropsis gaditana CCMP526]|eukprot:XP_005853594.1 solute carrier family 29 (nucleoside transporters) member 2 [Nannochloropsis gaditana CCMP526]